VEGVSTVGEVWAVSPEFVFFSFRLKMVHFYAVDALL